MSKNLHSCHTCGLVQWAGNKKGLQCTRCSHRLPYLNIARNKFASALALGALALYPPAMILPMLKIEQLGHSSQDSPLSGVIALLTEGYIVIGLIVLLFSVIFPPVKLLGLWYLGLLPSRDDAGTTRGGLYRILEFLGRWSMLDVMLVAILVAFVKLGDLVQIHAGPGIIAFSAMVILSLCSGILFNPHLMWKPQYEH